MSFIDVINWFDIKPFATEYIFVAVYLHNIPDEQGYFVVNNTR